MESLVHYQRLLLHNHYDPRNKELKRECIHLLWQLEKLDPATVLEIRDYILIS
jgi:hypothetical protein